MKLEEQMTYRKLEIMPRFFEVHLTLKFALVMVLKNKNTVKGSSHLIRENILSLKQGKVNGKVENKLCCRLWNLFILVFSIRQLWYFTSRFRSHCWRACTFFHIRTPVFNVDHKLTFT